MPQTNQSPTLKKISLFFLGLVILALILTAYFFIGEAKIYLTPSSKPVQVEFTIKVQTTPTDESLPGEIITDELSLEKTFPVSQTDQEQLGRSRGQITIVNQHSQDQTLIATTRFLTPDNVLFRLDKTVVVPAGAQIKASVTADKVGSQGDLKPPLKLTIPGLSSARQEKIYGEVEAAFSGGKVSLGSLSEADLAKAREELIVEAENQAKIKFLAEYLEELATTTPVLAPEVLTQVEVTAENSQPALGELASRFKLKLEVAVTGALFSRTELETLAHNKLLGSLKPGEKFIGIEPGSLKFSLQEVDPVNQLALIKVMLGGRSIFTPESQILDKRALKGLNQKELEHYFAQLPGVARIRVNFSPFWVKHVPRLIRNINIIIQEN